MESKLIVRINILAWWLLFAAQINFAQENVTVKNSISNNFNHSTNTKYFLNDLWSIEIPDIESKNNIVLPFYEKNKDIQSLSLKRSFSIPDSLLHSKIRIWIFGLSGNAIIKLNNHFLKNNPDVTTTCSIDIAPEIVKKENNLLEIILTYPDEDDIFSFTRFPNYLKQYRPLGVCGDVYLEFFDTIYIDDVLINYTNNKIFLTYKIVIENQHYVPGKTIKIDEIISNPDGAVVHKRFEYIDYKKSINTFTREISINDPQLWSPDNPYLYEFTISIKTFDSKMVERFIKFGLRTFSVIKKQIFLNDKSIVVKGINYRNNLCKNKNDLVEIKNIGFNSIRFVNYIPHPDIITTADSLGLLLFLDNGFWRLPSEFYSKNAVQQKIKTVTEEIIKVYANHPSVAAIGLGQEVPVESPTARKHIIILNEFVKSKLSSLTYISPNTLKITSDLDICDFLLIMNYDQFDKSIFKIDNRSLCILPGNIGFSYIHSEDIDINKVNYQKFYNFFSEYSSSNLFNGFFIESFNDWFGELPSVGTILNSDNKVIYPFGIYDIQSNSRNSLQFFSDYFNNKMVDLGINIYPDQTNFFSISVFIIVIILLVYYRRSYRYRENIKRSLKHPYGFFVDLRDRRIISVLNSTITGIIVSVVISSFLSSIVYANRNNIFMDEFVSIIFNNITIKAFYLDISNSPAKIFTGFFLITMGLLFILSLFLKLSSYFSKERIKLRQCYSVVSWAGTPMLFFLPISLFTNNLVAANLVFPYIIWLFILFLFWHNYRLANGIRVLFQMQPLNIVSIILLTYLVLLVIFYLSFGLNFQTFEDLNLLYNSRYLYY